MKKRHLLSLLALGISTACYGETYPAPIGPSQSDFGGVGLLQTPTARMAREGELSLNYRDNDQYRYYSASVQLFPWLETTLRYTDVRTRQYSSVEAFSGDQTYKDKAFDLKLRLWEESYWLPQVAVGARDIGGTGLFDAEYLVASKAWGPFDFTLGLGWGYLGTSGNVKNPLCSASDKYCYRDNSYKQAGSIDGSQMFHGPASLFGGVEYQTPWQPLRLKLEYEGNNYQQDFAGKLEQKSKSQKPGWREGTSAGGFKPSGSSFARRCPCVRQALISCITAACFFKVAPLILLSPDTLWTVSSGERKKRRQSSGSCSGVRNQVW